MEEVYTPRCKMYTNVNEFSTFREKILPNNIRKFPESLNDIKNIMEFDGTSEEFSDLCDSVCIDKHLKQCDDMRIAVFDPSVHQTRKKTMEIRKKALKLKLMQELFNEKLKRHRSKLRYLWSSHRYRYIKYEPTINVGPKDLTPYCDVVLTVRIYEPFYYTSGRRNYCSPKFSQEFIVLGSNCLTELRDKIYCQSNFGPFFDISENPNNQIDKKLSDSNNSGFFFISDVFYNDTRNPNNIDYSAVLMEFWKNQKMKKNLSIKIMEETYFKDFEINIGYPQVYQHSGNCEHLLTISNIRLLNKSDSLFRCDYPLLRRVSTAKPINCIICGSYNASYIVQKSVTQVQDPAHLCQNCFKSYHYIDGKKVGEFLAYKYYGNLPV